MKAKLFMKDEKDPFDLQAIEWIKRAEDDEINVVAILKDRDGTPMMVCFVCNQIAEKCLKAFLVHAIHDYPKIHPLDKLLKLCAQENIAFNDLQEEAILLNEYYTEARYPDNLPIESFTWEMAESAYAAAKSIRDFVEKNLK